VRSLAEIARIVERAADPSEQIFLPRKKLENKPLGRLFKGAVSGTLSTDEAAALTIFQTSPQSTKYATAKSRLKRRLLNSLMLLNLKKAGYTPLSQAQFGSYRMLFIVHALQILGARRVAMRIAERQYETAARFHITHVQLEFSQLLRFDASLKKSPSSFSRWSERTRKHIDELRAENLALDYFSELELNHNRRLMSVEQLAERATVHSASLEEISRSCDTFVFKTNYFRVRHLEQDLLGRLESLVQTCDEALVYFKRIPEFSNHAVVGEFAFRKLYACLKLRDTARGQQAYEMAISLVKEGSNNWFALQAYYALLLLHASRFLDAGGVIATVINHARFSSIPTPLQEQWKLYELHALYATDRLDSEGGKITKVKPSQRLEALLQVAPTLSQDKQGNKVSLLILHILYLLEIGDFNGIIDRMEALRLYRARYLKASQFPKTASFFKLLQIMENNSFSYKMVKEKGEKEYQKLLESNENQEEINEGLQILPYDWLWLKILDRLKEYEEKYARRGM
jgi:hypothetical protein